MSTTPLAACTPYTAAAEASLRTEMLSMSSGLIVCRGLPLGLFARPTGNPSTTNSGWVLPTVPTPRTRTDTAAPGAPDSVVTWTPAARPPRAASGLAAGTARRSSPVTCATDSVAVARIFSP